MKRTVGFLVLVALAGSASDLAQVDRISIRINGALPGAGNVCWYALDNLNDENIQEKRWDGDAEIFYFNPANLVAVTAYGVVNHSGN